MVFGHGLSSASPHSKEGRSRVAYARDGKFGGQSSGRAAGSSCAKASVWAAGLEPRSRRSRAPLPQGWWCDERKSSGGRRRGRESVPCAGQGSHPGRHAELAAVELEPAGETSRRRAGAGPVAVADRRSSAPAVKSGREPACAARRDQVQASSTIRVPNRTPGQGWLRDERIRVPRNGLGAVGWKEAAHDPSEHRPVPVGQGCPQPVERGPVRACGIASASTKRRATAVPVGGGPQGVETVSPCAERSRRPGPAAPITRAISAQPVRPRHCR